MFQAIRRRFNATGVVALLALVFAMGGGAYAAGRYVITSTKQISPKVLKALAGKPGTAGANGAQGQPGSAGSQGPAGPAGQKGESGATGPQGPAGAAGKNGENGTTGFAKVLPSKATETGTWSFSTPNPSYLFISLSFPIQLAEALGATQVHYVFADGKELNVKKELVSPADCPGSVAEPEAAPGHLCVYEKFTSGVSTVAAGKEGEQQVTQAEIFPSSGTPGLFGGQDGADTSGATLLFAPTDPEVEARVGWGTWAVTAE